MKLKQLTATAAVCALAAGGTSAAVAATSNNSSDSSTTKSAACAKPNGKGKRDGGPLKDVAAAIGIKVSDLQSQLKSGKKLSEIALAKGLTLDQVKSKVTASVKTKLDKAVADNKLTQAQADDQLSRVDNMIDDIEAGKTPLKGGPGGPGGGLGGPPPGA